MPAFDVIIVGAGPAGCAAAVQCRRLGLTVALLDRAGEPGGLTRQAWRIENYPGLDPLPGGCFAGHLRAFLDRFEIGVRREEVRSVARRGEGCSGAQEPAGAGPRQEAGWHVRGRGASYHAACLVLATGTEPRRPEIAGLASPPPGVYHDVVSLIEDTEAPGHAAILGGGEAACDHALLLAEAGWRVTMLLRGERLRARGRLAASVATHPAIARMTRTQLHAVTGPPLTLDMRRLVRAPSGGGAHESRTEHLAPGALLIAAGRRSTAGDLLAAGHAEAPQAQADRGQAQAPPPGTGRGHAEAPPAATDPGAGLWIAGDARTGTLGQIGIAVGDGLAAAMQIAAHLGEGRS